MNMSYIDNGQIKLGINLDIGGAITYLSKSGSDLNVINSHDWGRQIQLSFYGGPVPFEADGQKANPHWITAGWNPIQSGDCNGHGSKVVAHRKSRNSLYVKCIPMQWALNGVPGECSYECWISLEGITVKVKSRIVNHRSDKIQYEGRGQELPAVYTNGPWYRVFTYTGDKPYSKDKLTQYPSTFPPTIGLSSENWAAIVDDNDWGLGIYEPGIYTIAGCFVGTTYKGGPKDDPTGYLSPQADEILDHNIDTSFNYVLILGSLKEIRDHVYKQPRPSEHPNWVFKNDRHYWTYQNAVDTGWPIKDELNIDISKDNGIIYSPIWLWEAARNPVLYIKAAFSSGQKTANVTWQRKDGQAFSPQTSVSFPVIADGNYHVYAVKLAANAEYKGLITRLALVPDPKGVAGRWLKLKSVGFKKLAVK